MGELGRDGMTLPISLSEEQGPGGGDDDARNSADPGCGGCRGLAAFQSSTRSVRGAFTNRWDVVRRSGHGRSSSTRQRVLRGNTETGVTREVQPAT